MQSAGYDGWLPFPSQVRRIDNMPTIDCECNDNMPVIMCECNDNMPAFVPVLNDGVLVYELLSPIEKVMLEALESVDKTEMARAIAMRDCDEGWDGGDAV